jgi:23S rRNA (adenine2503-C2)-methyltransferase
MPRGPLCDRLQDRALIAGPVVRTFMNMDERKPNLLGYSLAELTAFAEGLGESRYRGRQLFQWLYAHGAGEFAGMSSLGKQFRGLLENSAMIAGVEPVAHQQSAVDGTIKYLFALADGLRIESVLIPPASAFADEEAAGEDEQRRLTLCVSTQVGCPLDCAFCATATMGFRRNLTAGEIIDQLLAVRRLSGRDVTNVVFMGMGEPLINYDNAMKAAAIMTDGMEIAARRITVSTAGWVDGIRRMGDEQCKVKLAVSLHSAVDSTRSRLMPVTRRYSVASLIDAVEYYYRRTKRRVTYEYIFFDGVNDTDHEVRELVRLARRVPCKINVIPFHPISFAAPAGVAASLRPSPRMEAAVEELRSRHLTVMVRSSAGEDIDGACGQLVVKTEHRRRAQARPAARISN